MKKKFSYYLEKIKSIRIIIFPISNGSIYGWHYKNSWYYRTIGYGHFAIDFKNNKYSI